MSKLVCKRIIDKDWIVGWCDLDGTKGPGFELYVHRIFFYSTALVMYIPGGGNGHISWYRHGWWTAVRTISRGPKARDEITRIRSWGTKFWVLFDHIVIEWNGKKAP